MRYLRVTGIVRRSRLVALLAGTAIAAILALGATGVDVLLAYELALIVTGVAIAVDLRWSPRSITGLVVDLGRRPVGGAIREWLAHAVGDPTLDVAYVVDGEIVDEFGRPVALPAGGSRIVTRVSPEALLIRSSCCTR